jgi:hypothetical protein
LLVEVVEVGSLAQVVVLVATVQAQELLVAAHLPNLNSFLR